MKSKIVAALRLGGTAGLVGALSACGPGGQKTAQTAPPPAPEVQASEAGYLVTPSVLAAERRPDGGVVLTGRAPPDSLVRLASPEGDAFGASAGADGGWRLELAPVARARMFALSADVAGRPVHAQGALVVMPAPSPAALMVRAGYGALPVGQPGAQPRIVALDYDSAGVAAVAGLATPRATVQLTLDGATAGQTRADARGRFAMLAPNHPLAAGPHLAAVTTPAGSAQLTVQIAPAAPLATPYRAAREGSAWRIDWTPPGGGLQTTLVPDQGPAA